MIRSAIYKGGNGTFVLWLHGVLALRVVVGVEPVVLVVLSVLGVGGRGQGLFGVVRAADDLDQALKELVFV